MTRHVSLLKVGDYESMDGRRLGAYESLRCYETVALFTTQPQEEDPP